MLIPSTWGDRRVSFLLRECLKSSMPNRGFWSLLPRARVHAGRKRSQFIGMSRISQKKFHLLHCGTVLYNMQHKQVSYLGIIFAQNTLTVSPQHGEKGILQTQHRENHQSSAVHPLQRIQPRRPHLWTLSGIGTSTWTASRKRICYNCSLFEGTAMCHVVWHGDLLPLKSSLQGHNFRRFGPAVFQPFTCWLYDRGRAGASTSCTALLLDLLSVPET